MATLLRRLYDEPLAQASYILGCTRTKEALVVDPNRDIDQYLRAAASDGLRIAHVTETHVHADFVSGSRELGRSAQARLHLSDAGPADWKYRYAKEDGANLLTGGSSIDVGELRVDVLHTPGHTPEHLTFLVTEKEKTDEPMGAFTGDFLFVGDVGRPDLLERAAGAAIPMRESAAQLFRSLRDFQRFPDHLQIWPGHGAGSPCGKSLGAVPQSTLGYERVVNWALAESDEHEFVRRVLEGQPEPPRYFAVMKRVNRDGPQFLDSLHAPVPLAAVELAAALEGRSTVVDTRDAASYARQHITGTINVPLGKQFPFWAGSVLPYHKPIYVIAESGRPALAEAAIRQLYLIGADDVWGYLTWDLLAGWNSDSHPMSAIEQVSPAELGRMRERPSSLQIVDVRNGYEWDADHIDGARHIPLAELTDRASELDPTQPVVVHCQMGGRSAVAASVLESRGFRAVSNLVGGFKAWTDAGR